MVKRPEKFRRFRGDEALRFMIGNCNYLKWLSGKLFLHDAKELVSLITDRKGNRFLPFNHELSSSQTMLNINQLNHTAIHVADLERSVAFYRDVLQLEPMPRPNFNFAGAWFRTGPDQELHLICKGGSYTVPLERHTAYRIPDMAAAKAHLDIMGIAYEGPKYRPDGPLQLFLDDPDGHVIELTQLDV